MELTTARLRRGALPFVLRASKLRSHAARFVLSKGHVVGCLMGDDLETGRPRRGRGWCREDWI